MQQTTASDMISISTISSILPRNTHHNCKSFNAINMTIMIIESLNISKNNDMENAKKALTSSMNVRAVNQSMNIIMTNMKSDIMNAQHKLSCLEDSVSKRDRTHLILLPNFGRLNRNAEISNNENKLCRKFDSS